jgi:hypothetical protein
MRLQKISIAAAALGALALSACEPGAEGSAPIVSAPSAIVPAETCGATTWDLTAGQTIDVGSVSVSNDADYLYVTYGLDYPGATFGALHLWVGNSLLNLPANAQGIPVPGQFCSADGGACADASGLVSYTFQIPFADLNIVDASAACGSSLYVVTHAEVSFDSDGDGEVDGETAFGGPISGSGPRWWYYGAHSICCDFGNPDPPVCETAFAKGGWVFTTDKKSNPEALPSLALTKNRWGWAIDLLAPGDYHYDVWAGAGLNKTSKGELVGEVDVSWDGASAVVTYSVFDGTAIEEVHLYAGDAAPATVAPGQYGYLAEFDPNVSTYSFVVPLADADDVSGVWLIAHAVVCH